MANPAISARRFACFALALTSVAACGDITVPAESPDPDAILQLAIDPGPYTPGQSYFGRNGYIEYVAGNAPVILTAPHGGDLEPGEIPKRTGGACGGDVVTTTDLNTRELTLAVQQAFHALYGTYPHVVLVHLDRSKLDANRDVTNGACGDPEAEEAWTEYHDFITVAKTEVLSSTGRGWYMDLHGHGHSVQRLELGYLLSGSELRLSDATLDGDQVYEDDSSIKTMSEFDGAETFSQLLRGPTSLGTLYENNGIPAVPSAQDPAPDQGESYFSGGYNTKRHTCGLDAAQFPDGAPGGNICGLQIEANYSGVRDTEANRADFGTVTAAILGTYLMEHWGIDLDAGPTNTPPEASFTHSCADLACTFTDASTDPDGSIVSWSWDFGDGQTSTAQHPSHTYAAPGTYTVNLTVTDNAGGFDSTAQDVPAGAVAIMLSAETHKSGGDKLVHLTWSGATSSDVDVYRDDALITTTANDGAHTDQIRGRGKNLTYRVCEAGTTTCSNPVTVSF